MARKGGEGEENDCGGPKYQSLAEMRREEEKHAVAALRRESQAVAVVWGGGTP
jgi:hypothetical protein